MHSEKLATKSHLQQDDHNDHNERALPPSLGDETEIDADKFNGQTELIGQHEQQPAMTKNQIKKLRRKQFILEKRPEKRRQEKERRRQNRLLARAKEEEEAKAQGVECQPDLKRADHHLKRKLMRDSDNKFRVVIDMDYSDFMTDDEIAKATKQCSRSYALNRKSQHPCQFYVSSVSGKIRDRFNITCVGHQNWDANISNLDYIDVFLPPQLIESHDQAAKEEARDKIKRDIIYLTGDTEELLPDVEKLLQDDSKIFVIGGLVDHNRHKNLCYQRAQERHIRTAKLPIKGNLKLSQRHILSTLTVFDIVLKVLGEHKSWREALLASIPKRKIHESELDQLEANRTSETTAHESRPDTQEDAQDNASAEEVFNKTQHK